MRARCSILDVAGHRAPAASGPPVAGHGRRLLASPGLVDPNQMPSDERLQEVISHLARGFLRSRFARAVDGGEKDLDVLRTSSEVCPEPTSEGESV